MYSLLAKIFGWNKNKGSNNIVDTDSVSTKTSGISVPSSVPMTFNQNSKERILLKINGNKNAQIYVPSNGYFSTFLVEFLKEYLDLQEGENIILPASGIGTITFYGKKSRFLCVQQKFNQLLTQVSLREMVYDLTNVKMDYISTLILELADILENANSSCLIFPFVKTPNDTYEVRINIECSKSMKSEYQSLLTKHKVKDCPNIFNFEYDVDSKIAVFRIKGNVAKKLAEKINKKSTKITNKDRR